VAAVDTHDAVWRERFRIAREALLDGEFGRAEGLFGELARTARTETERALAHEDARLAATWAARGATLEAHATEMQQTDSRAASDRRSTDELVSLYSNATFYGLGTGVWLAAQTDPDTAAEAILPALGFAGAAVGAVALADRGRGFRYGVPQSIVSGLYVGLEEGISLVVWNNDRGGSAEWSAQTNASMIWGGATLGAAAGGLVSSLVPTTPGEASWVGSSALWAGVLSVLVTTSLEEEDSAETPFYVSSIAIPFGAMLGVGTARHVAPSVARARLLDLGGVAGGLLAGGLYLAAADSDVDGHAMAGTTAAGVAGGLVGAWLLTQSMAPDPIAKHQSTATGRALTPFVVPVAGGIGIGLAGAL